MDKIKEIAETNNKILLTFLNPFKHIHFRFKILG